ncbi:hypothetical protein [Nostoc linckia]|uniref:hypothetical protein n=1 Tax=Nostoc linckia TaxID=92942 RepID=UPI00117BE513|nr:hypothetical protein [Nostoc linckia]
MSIGIDGAEGQGRWGDGEIGRLVLSGAEVWGDREMGRMRENNNSERHQSTIISQQSPVNSHQSALPV